MTLMYRANFRLGKEKDGKVVRPSLEDITETFSNWVARSAKVNNVNLEPDRTELVDDLRGKGEVSMVVVPEKNNILAGFRYHLVTADGGIWQTDLTTSMETAMTEITLGHGSKDSRIVPVQNIVTRPKLVPDLIDRFGAKKIVSLSTFSLMVDNSDIDLLGRFIKLDERTLPIVYISLANDDRKPLLDAKKTAWELAGLAYVCEAHHSLDKFALGNIVGSDLNCYNGAVRLHWPMTDHRVNHTLFRPEYVRSENGKMPKRLLAKIAKWSVRNAPQVLTFGEMRRKSLEISIAETSERRKRLKNDYEQAKLQLEESDKELKYQKDLASEFEKEVDLLKTKLGELEESLDSRETELISAQNDARRFQYRIEDLERKLGETQREVKPVPEIDSVRSAKELFYDNYPQYKDNIYFTSRALQGIDDSLFENPGQFYILLEWLVKEYRAIKCGVFRDDPALSLGEKNGMQYKPNESKNTMRANKDVYSANVGGETFWFSTHARQGRKPDPRSCIRVGFDYDKKNDRVIVGYVCPHAPNTKTN